MTIKKARELLGDDNYKYTDDQVLSLISQLQVLAEIAIDQVLKSKTKENN